VTCSSLHGPQTPSSSKTLPMFSYNLIARIEKMHITVAWMRKTFATLGTACTRGYNKAFEALKALERPEHLERTHKSKQATRRWRGQIELHAASDRCDIKGRTCSKTTSGSDTAKTGADMCKDDPIMKAIRSSSSTYPNSFSYTTPGRLCRATCAKSHRACRQCSRLG